MIGILSDAHGNRPAFDLSIKLLRRHGAERFIFLGDAVGYIPMPDVISSIRDLGEEIICVRGNHEDTLLGGVFDPTRDAVYQHAIIKSQMTVENIDFIIGWPTQLNIKFEAGKVMLIHGSPKDHLRGYLYPDTDLSIFKVEETFVFMGHTHRPFIRNESRTTYVNVGSCGLPRDNGVLGSVVLFDELTGAVRILRFDIRKQIDQVSEMVGCPFHPSVRAIFQRQEQLYEGELTIIEE